MKNRLWLTLAFLLIPMTLCAATVQLPETGQSSCWDSAGLPIDCTGTGQDGDAQVGAAWPETRFTVNGDQTVTDALTGLVWLADPAAQGPDACGAGATLRAWQEALDYTACLNSNRHLGHDDWRLPNLAELESLVNLQGVPYAWLNEQGFNVQPANYWSASSYAKDPGYAWYVNLAEGYPSGLLKTAGSYAWPVRSARTDPPTILLPQTGQTSCWDSAGNSIACEGTGQDGDIAAGTAWPAERFADLGDQTMIDNLTGLIWSQDVRTPGPAACAPGTSKDWQAALDYITCLNSNSYLGFDDWRLPNRTELKSTINIQALDTYAWLNDQGFVNAQDTTYWSSSTCAKKADEAWIVYINDGCTDPDSKALRAYVWPVRGGRTSELAVLMTGYGSGEVVPDSGSLTWSDKLGAGSYAEDAAVTLTATAVAGSKFAGWGGACSGTGTCLVTLGANRQVTAAFYRQFAQAPAGITVPPADADGEYTIKWQASPTEGVTYVLQEAVNPYFTVGVRNYYPGAVLSRTITGQPQNVTYYYRVKARKAGFADSPWRRASSGCAVPGTAVAAAPPTLTVPSGDSDGVYAVAWGSSPTTGTAYLLEEATNPTFTAGLRVAYSGAALSRAITGRVQNATYYYRVKAIKPGLRDSFWRVPAKGCAVPGTRTVDTPATLTVPVNDADGGYPVSWAASLEPAAKYFLQEATNATFTTGLRTAYFGTETSKLITGRVPGKTYFYRIQAVKPGVIDSWKRVDGSGCTVP